MCNGLFCRPGSVPPMLDMRKAQGDQSHPPGTEREQKSDESQGCLFTHFPTPLSLNQRHIPGIKSTQSFLSQMQAVTISAGELQA